MTLIEAGELDDSFLGKPIRYDGDEPTIYGGKHPHHDKQEGHFFITLDGRMVEGWDFDYVWIDNQPGEHQMVREGMSFSCLCGEWKPKLGESVWRSYDKHLIVSRDD